MGKPKPEVSSLAGISKAIKELGNERRGVKTITRSRFKEMLSDTNRKFCWATLHEVHDLFVDFGNEKKPVREITNEPNHWNRAIKIK